MGYPPVHPSHVWGYIGTHKVCKKCCWGVWSKKALVECEPEKAKLRPMEKRYS